MAIRASYYLKADNNSTCQEQILKLKISKEQLVPCANRLVIKKNNQRVASDSHITDTMLRFVVEILRHHKLYNPVFLTATMPHLDPNNIYTKPPLENQILEFIKTLGYDEDPKTKMIVVSKMDAIRLYQPWRAIHSVLNRSLTGKDSSWDTVRLSILQILWGDYKFGMEIPNTMISDAIKKLAGYKYYMAKKVETENAKTVDEPEEQHLSTVKNTYSEWGQKLKGPAVDDPAVQSLLNLRKGSKVSRLESLNVTFHI
ncbi:hypothetical protein Tco_0431414 [Tanacetum coccineum]